MKFLFIACAALAATAAHAEQYTYDSYGTITGVIGSPANVNAEEASMEDINASLDVSFDPRNISLTGRTREEQAFVEDNFESMLQGVGGGSVNAVVDKGPDGLYRLYVDAPGGSYSCLASPGKPGKGGAVATPRFQNKVPYLAEAGIHIVSGRKSYAGARMPYPVWISGGFAIHGGDGGGPAVTGRRESHGCVRVACSQRFNRDVRAVGLSNTRITIRTN